MRPTFYSFEIAKSGIQAAQTGLDVTGQNVSNVNTQGYARQAVDQVSASYTTSRGKVASNTFSLGGGVTVNDIVQIRDSFLDVRYRSANAQAQTLNTTSSVLGSIENILDETKTDGLGSTLGDFYKQLQILSDNAGNVEFSNIARSSAQKIVETLHQYTSQLDNIRQQNEYDLGVVVGDVNSLINKISSLNDTIKSEKLFGSVSNELLDTRNSYLDKLSGYLNIEVTPKDDGTVSITSGGVSLLDSVAGTKTELGVKVTGGTIQIVNQADDSEFSISQGQIKGYLQSLNGLGSYAGASQDSFTGLAFYEKALDDFASSFANAFNNVNKIDPAVEKPLFSGNISGVVTAANINLSAGWRADANYITATTGSSAAEGNNDNILCMISLMDSDMTVSPGFKGTFEEYATSLISSIATDTNFCNETKKTSNLILSSIDNQRESVMGVSLNEETVNLLRYQKAFDASSRFLTVLDEALDTIINKDGHSRQITFTKGGDFYASDQ